MQIAIRKVSIVTMLRCQSFPRLFATTQKLWKPLLWADLWRQVDRQQGIWTQMTRAQPLPAVTALGLHPMGMFATEMTSCKFFTPALYVFANRWEQTSRTFNRRLNKLRDPSHGGDITLPSQKQTEVNRSFYALTWKEPHVTAYCYVKMLSMEQGTQNVFTCV